MPNLADLLRELDDLNLLDRQTSRRLQRIQIAMSLFETLARVKGTEKARNIVASIIKEVSAVEAEGP